MFVSGLAEIFALPFSVFAPTRPPASQVLFDPCSAWESSNYFGLLGRLRQFINSVSFWEKNLYLFRSLARQLTRFVAGSSSPTRLD